MLAARQERGKHGKWTLPAFAARLLKILATLPALRITYESCIPRSPPSPPLAPAPRHLLKVIFRPLKISTRPCNCPFNWNSKKVDLASFEDLMGGKLKDKHRLFSWSFPETIYFGKCNFNKISWLWHTGLSRFHESTASNKKYYQNYPRNSVNQIDWPIFTIISFW